MHMTHLGKRFLAFATLGLTPLLGAGLKIELPVDTPQIKSGEHRNAVFVNCVLCHSLDYVTTQPPLSRAVWKATVLKMRATYGAPVPENQIEAIVEYLVRAYGEEQAAQSDPGQPLTAKRTSADVVPKK
jgi:hypothetical protein